MRIATEARERDRGFGDSQAIIKMTLRNQRGEATVRVMRSRSLEIDGDGDRSMVIFDEPRDVAGTAFLTFTHRVKDDDQWLYLPALGRVKRIASSNKSGPFMGSELSYEDLSSPEVEKYDYVHLGDETFDDREHFMLQRTPKDTRSGYRRMVVWIDKLHYRTFKIDYYDRRNALLKTLTTERFELYEDRHWRPIYLLMVNHQNSRSTGLEWTDYVFHNGYTEADFNRNNLSKIR
ncbi:MAG: outer membrane lipoprotein-sorting protein [Gammaproteobacteria bacterium]